MQLDTIAQYAGVSQGEIKRLLALPSQDIYQDPTYQSWVKQLDQQLLLQSSEAVRNVYDRELPDLKDRYGLTGSIMSSYTLCNWVLGFLMFPARLSNMIEHHASVPTGTIGQALPELLEYVGEIPTGGAEWQRALTLMTLPLLVRD
jgi:hypothetical protein